MKSDNKDLENIAKKILDGIKMENNPKYGFIDPITIILIISIVLTLIRVIQECRKNRKLLKSKKEAAMLLKKDIQDIIIKDTIWSNLRLRKILKQKLSKDQYKAYGQDLRNSIMEVGINLTDDEVYTLMEAAND